MVSTLGWILRDPGSIPGEHTANFSPSLRGGQRVVTSLQGNSALVALTQTEGRHLKTSHSNSVWAKLGLVVVNTLLRFHCWRRVKGGSAEKCVSSL